MRVTILASSKPETHKIRKFFGVLSTLLSLTFIIILLISGYKLWTLIHPPKIGITAFSSNIVPEFQNISFKSSDNEIQLKGWFFESKGSSKTVILAHGYGRNRLQFEEKTLEIIKVLLLKGYNVLAFDFRNSGESEGKTSTAGIDEKTDLLSAVKFVTSKGSKNIALLGFSTGASASLAAASESKDVHAVISDTAIADYTEYLSKSFHQWSTLPKFPFNQTSLWIAKTLKGKDMAEASPQNKIKDLASTPILFIHSQQDTLIPFSNTRTLYSLHQRTANGKSQLWETQAPGHLGSFEQAPQVYMKKVTEFLDGALKGK